MNWLDLIKLPVGNFYAFLTFLGLSLLVFSLVFPLVELNKSNQEFTQIQRDKRMLNIERDAEFFKIVRQNHENSGSIRHFTKSALDELRGADGQFTDNGLELEKQRIDLFYRRQAHDRDFKQIVDFERLFNLLSFLGFGLLMLGGLMWFYRSQKPLDRQLKNDVAKNDSQEKLIVTASLDQVIMFGQRNRSFRNKG